MLDSEDMERLGSLGNEHVIRRVKHAIGLCKPSSVKILTDSLKDLEYTRQVALHTGEERKLNLKGHTVHFDGYYDQARDKANTRYLLPAGKSISNYILSKEREPGLKEVLSCLDGSMQGKEMLVSFYCLGPVNSKFSLHALQITDSPYVCHSEDILYRPGFEQFKRLRGSKDFFYFLHSAGKLRNGVSVDIDKRRIYIDLQDKSVYTVNNQYAGNSLGLKKLAMRLAIKKASEEGWMTEHMFIMAAHGPRGRRTYFSGAFPSACGKTSTAMIDGQSIVSDDIAYLRPWHDGTLHGVNVEQGIFGIIEDISPDDDPVIYKALTTPRELILSNVLVVDGVPYWLGMGKKLPDKGINFSGNWHRGKVGPDGKAIPPSHRNARYTIRLSELDNMDDKADDPKGVEIAGFIFGGRDSDTSVPVSQSMSWNHGVLLAASLESETTAATLGKRGRRIHSPMANIDFLSISLGKYIDEYMRMGKRLKKPPLIFSVNYFLKEGDMYLNGMLDKHVWLMWLEGRIHGEIGAMKTPVGYIPLYPDLRRLFKKILKRDYPHQEYERQFSIRLDRYLDKFMRIEGIYAREEGIPASFIAQLKSQQQRLLAARKRFGKGTVLPERFA